MYFGVFFQAIQQHMIFKYKPVALFLTVGPIYESVTALGAWSVAENQACLGTMPTAWGQVALSRSLEVPATPLLCIMF